MDKKRKYQELKLEMVLFSNEDVIATSYFIDVPWNETNWGEGWE